MSHSNLLSPCYLLNPYIHVELQCCEIMCHSEVKKTELNLGQLYFSHRDIFVTHYLFILLLELIATTDFEVYYVFFNYCLCTILKLSCELLHVLIVYGKRSFPKLNNLIVKCISLEGGEFCDCMRCSTLTLNPLHANLVFLPTFAFIVLTCNSNIIYRLHVHMLMRWWKPAGVSKMNISFNVMCHECKQLFNNVFTNCVLISDIYIPIVDPLSYQLCSFKLSINTNDYTIHNIYFIIYCVLRNCLVLSYTVYVYTIIPPYHTCHYLYPPYALYYIPPPYNDHGDRPIMY